MDNRDELRNFLMSRRARITPEEAGLDNVSGQRREQGLRRSDVALLAGVSTDYYAKLERGQLPGASERLLSAVADVLRLDETDRRLLRKLAQNRATHHRSRAYPQAVQRLLMALSGVPVVVRNQRLDLLGGNELGKALYADALTSLEKPVNEARFVFLDPLAGEFWVRWDKAADDCVAALQAAVTQNPQDRKLSLLIGELATRSEAFRVRWAAAHAQSFVAGNKVIQHRSAGLLELSHDRLTLASAPGLTLLVYGAEPGSPTWSRLTLLLPGEAHAMPA
ncbi:helix-turn-helix domain-containing protein [Kineosporia sp. J2-2]|uniref:Helix-turn-helix domain-containing protein n=1 Tax=Kineosporia corallincola TaxID=2835133 RepID=A0ABS5TTW3_9ACTN|nr:helix-turn-helix transcriptional regulator [Kineosporia corallincola]MBT0774239.1 helix-turn-helix domain-containing protein [Kineosporia corallincola]